MAGTYQVIITEPAQKDLENIINYIGEEKGSVQGAENVKTAILKAINTLAKMPDRHGRVKEVAHKEDIVYRRVIVDKKYRIMYKIEEVDDEVYVVRILHVKRGPNFVRNALK